MRWPDGWTVLPVEGVSVEVSAPPFNAECRWPAKENRRDVSTVVRIIDTSVEGAGMIVPPTRINLYSASARNGLAVGLKDERRERFVKFVNQLMDLLHEIYTEQSPLVPLRHDVESPPTRWMLYPIWPATGGTGIAAAPGALKSYAALAIALSVATGAETLAGNTRPGDPKPILYLDWEADRDEMQRRLKALCAPLGIDPAGQITYAHMRNPLADGIHDLTERVADFGGVVVDSMSAAIGGSMIEDDRVNQFWDAIRAVDLPTLVLAHKSVDNIRRRERRFFGSIMNEARVRMAWNAERQPGTTRVLWECFKDSNGKHHGNRLAWTWTFNADPEDEDRLESVTAAALQPDNVHLGGEQMSIADRILAELEFEPVTAGELAKLLDANPGSIRRVLGKLRDDGDVSQRPDTRWENTMRADARPENRQKLPDPL